MVIEKVSKRMPSITFFVEIHQIVQHAVLRAQSECRISISGVNTEDAKHTARSAEARRFVYTENAKHDVRPAEDRLFVNTKYKNNDARPAEDRLFVNTEYKNKNARPAEGRVFVNTRE